MEKTIIRWKQPSIFAGFQNSDHFFTSEIQELASWSKVTISESSLAYFWTQCLNTNIKKVLSSNPDVWTMIPDTIMVALAQT